MLVRQPHRLRPSRLDREDARAHQVEPGKLKKRGVARLGDDPIIGLSSLVPRKQPGRRLRSAPLERESADHRAVGHRNQQLGLLAHPRSGCGGGSPSSWSQHPVADHHPDGHARDLKCGSTAGRVRARLRNDHVRGPRMSGSELHHRAGPASMEIASKISGSFLRLMFHTLRSCSANQSTSTSL